MLAKIIWVSLVGGLINLDEHTMVHSMICRPIVAGPVIGYLLGDFSTGMIFGIMLELILFNVLPVGAAMPINYSMITVLAVSLSILISEATNIPIGPSFIVWMLACVIPLGIIFGELENLNRRFNVILVHFAEKRVLEGNLNVVEAVTFIGVLVSFFKAFIFIMTALWMGIRLLPKLYSIMPGKVLDGLGNAYIVIFILGMAIVIRTLRFNVGKINGKNNAD